MYIVFRFFLIVHHWKEIITDPVLTQSMELILIGQIFQDTYPVLEEVWIQIFVKSVDEFHIWLVPFYLKEYGHVVNPNNALYDTYPAKNIVSPRTYLT